jgi:hypothetical protein
MRSWRWLYHRCNHMHITKCCAIFGNTVVSGFKSHLWGYIDVLFVVVLNAWKQKPGQYLKLGHDCFLSTVLKIHYSIIITSFDHVTEFCHGRVTVTFAYKVTCGAIFLLSTLKYNNRYFIFPENPGGGRSPPSAGVCAFQAVFSFDSIIE